MLLFCCKGSFSIHKSISFLKPILFKYLIFLGVDHQDELEADGVPPYEDRLGPDGAEGENPILPQVTILYLYYIYLT